MKETVKTDALVTAADVEQMQNEVLHGDFKRLVSDLIVREPELTIAVSDRFSKIVTMLEAAMLTIKQRGDITKQMSLLVWLPILLLDRSHRRGWDDFLPIDHLNEEGGNQ